MNLRGSIVDITDINFQEEKSVSKATGNKGL